MDVNERIRIKIAMVAGGDREHAQPVETNAKRERLPGHAGPDRRDAA